jgi:hypothetical protein
VFAEGHKLVFPLIRQAETTDRHVDVVRDLGLWPAVDLFGFPRWAPKQVNRGLVSAGAPVSVCVAVSVVDKPSRWQELQLPFPLKSL